MDIVSKCLVFVKSVEGFNGLGAYGLGAYVLACQVALSNCFQYFVCSYILTMVDFSTVAFQITLAIEWEIDIKEANMCKGMQSCFAGIQETTRPRGHFLTKEMQAAWDRCN